MQARRYISPRMQVKKLEVDGVSEKKEVSKMDGSKKCFLAMMMNLLLKWH